MGTRHSLRQSKYGTTRCHKEEHSAFLTSYSWAVVRDALLSWPSGGLPCGVELWGWFSRLFLEPGSYPSTLLSSECAWIRKILKRLAIRVPVVGRAFKYVSVGYVDWCRRFRFDAADPTHDPVRSQHFTVTDKAGNLSLVL